MYRSVMPSRQAREDGRKGLRWIEGVGVGLVVFLGMLLLFGWL